MSSGVTPSWSPPITIDGLSEIVVVIPNWCATLAIRVGPTELLRPTRAKTLLSETASASERGMCASM